MNRLALSITLLLAIIALAGCYTQIGYYEPRSSTRQTSYHHQDEHQREDEDEKMESEREPQEEIETEGELSEVENEGYYGRRKPSYSYSDRYYRSYYNNNYPAYPYYYGGYHPLYPYYRYSYPYYSSYGYYPYYGGYRYRPYRYRYSTPRSKIGDLNFGKRRSQSYRGVRSHHSSSRRLDKSLRKSEESRTPARSSSESRRDRSRRSGRR